MSKSRCLKLNDKPDVDGAYTLYVMSRDQRVQDNHALLAAQEKANKQKVPLVVLFVLYEKSGHRSQEQFRFMLEGLEQVQRELEQKNIQFVLRNGIASEVILKFIKNENPSAVYFDFSPLNGPRAVQKKIAKQTKVSCYVVDAHNVIPVWILSDKEEFAAHTIRSKVHKQLDDWVKEPEALQKHKFTRNKQLSSLSFKEAHRKIEDLESTTVSYKFTSGEKAAANALDDFIENRLERYALDRNTPTLDALSKLSPYLHFGQISSLRVALEVLKKATETPLLYKQGKLAQAGEKPSLMDGINALLEELIVRKELADNYCFYNKNYDNFDGARDWAKDTLNDHRDDEREHVYLKKEWEQAATHDEPWNAAQKQMMKTGKMHGYMRMYWAKKILEWSKSPEEAIETTVYLNDKYSLDGGDPNGYTGIMWSIAGIHDRPWTERKVFGKIRYMNASGLQRKFDVEEYIKRWNT